MYFFFRFFKSIFNRIFLKKNINYYYYQISLKFYEIIIIVQLSSICFRFIYERMHVAAYNEVHIYNAWYNAPSLLVSAQLHVPLHSSKTLQYISGNRCVLGIPSIECDYTHEISYYPDKSLTTIKFLPKKIRNNKYFN